MVKVILVEDDRTMLNLLSVILDMEGFQVIPVSETPSIQAVINQLHQNTPALVLMDVNMDTLNGLDLLTAIREDANLTKTRVLMSSGMDVGDQCIARGADGFILKPYMPETLIAQIKSLVDSNSIDYSAHDLVE